MIPFIKSTFLLVLLSALLFVLSHLIHLISISPREVFPDDTYLSTVSHKKALAIVAHDDDLALAAGTLAHLRDQGWEIDYVSFYKGRNDSLEKVRKAELTRVSQIQGFNLKIVDFEFVVLPENVDKYMSMPYARFATFFHLDSIQGQVENFIMTSKPSVIFSLDDVIGGYGHAEHVAVSQSIVKVARKLAEKGLWKVNRVYQLVYPDSQEKATNNRLPVYHQALKDYEADGMPAPDVRIDISAYHAEKMAVIKAYASQYNALHQMARFFYWYPSWVYFRVFGYEYFRIVEIA